MSIIDTIRLKLNKAKEHELTNTEAVEKMEQVAETLDDKMVFEIVRTLLLVLPPNVAFIIYHVLQLIAPYVDDSVEEKLYFPELKEAAKTHI